MVVWGEIIFSDADAARGSSGSYLWSKTYLETYEDLAIEYFLVILRHNGQS